MMIFLFSNYKTRELYFNRGKAKILLGVCRGKKNYDKRESIKERDLKREMSKNQKYHNS